MLDFSLHGEEGKNPEKSQGLTEKQRKARFSKERDEDSMTNTRVKEYRQSKIDRSIEMVKEAIKKGILRKTIADNNLSSGIGRGIFKA
jgi:hypothetical protein